MRTCARTCWNWLVRIAWNVNACAHPNWFSPQSTWSWKFAHLLSTWRAPLPQRRIDHLLTTPHDFDYLKVFRFEQRTNFCCAFPFLRFAMFQVYFDWSAYFPISISVLNAFNVLFLLCANWDVESFLATSTSTEIGFFLWRYSKHRLNIWTASDIIEKASEDEANATQSICIRLNNAETSCNKFNWFLHGNSSVLSTIAVSFAAILEPIGKSAFPHTYQFAIWMVMYFYAWTCAALIRVTNTNYMNKTLLITIFVALCLI